MRGLNGKYGRWDEILRDILNGKLKIVQNPKQPESETEDEDDVDEEMPEETGTPTKAYDTSERNGSYVPIRTSPEEDALQIYTDGETTGENLENQIQIRRSNRNSKKPKRYGSIPYTGNFWVRTTGCNKSYVYYRKLVEQAQRNTSAREGPEAIRFLSQREYTPRTIKPELRRERG